MKPDPNTDSCFIPALKPAISKKNKAIDATDAIDDELDPIVASSGDFGYQHDEEYDRKMTKFLDEYQEWGVEIVAGVDP